MADDTSKVNTQTGSKKPEHPDAGARHASEKHGLPRVQPTQPEDATHTTGAGGEAHDQTLGHNVQGRQAHRSEHSAPAQHATGSYTDDKKK